MRSRSPLSVTPEGIMGVASKCRDTGSGGKPSSPPRSRDRHRDTRLEGHGGVTRSCLHWRDYFVYHSFFFVFIRTTSTYKDLLISGF